MDKAEIVKMKANIKSEYELKIKKLKEEMENALSSLSRVEKTLMEEIPSESIIVKEPIRHIKIPKRKQLKVRNGKSEKQRVMAALQEMNAEFSTGELKEKINNDGSGNEIKRGTFAGIFANLIKDQKIIVVQERKGSQGGRYLKSA